MNEFLRDHRDLLLSGKLLQKSLLAEIREAEEHGWPEKVAIDIRDRVEKYLRLASRVARIFALLIVVPLLFVIVCLTQSRAWPVFYDCYVIYVGVLALRAAFLFHPVFFIAPMLRRMPEAIYKELTHQFWLNLELLILSANAGLLVYIFTTWRVVTTLPIFLLLALFAVFGPWLAFAAKRDTLFIQLRLVQFATFIVAALVSAGMPVPARHYQWWAEQKLAETVRPFQQHEVTAQWKTLRWFTQEGSPSVWYALSGDTYRLFDGPGHDPESNAELVAVDSGELKQRIVASFRAQEVRKEQRLALAERKAEEDRETAEREKTGAVVRREKQMQAQRAADAKRELIGKFIRPGREPNKATSALVARVNGQPDEKVSRLFVAIFQKANTPVDPRIFSTAFGSSAEFQQLSAGQKVEGFAVSDYCTGIVCADVAVSYGKIQQPAEMVTADVKLRLSRIAADGGKVEAGELIESRGVGFSEAQAFDLALQRVEGAAEAQARALLK